MISKKYWKEQLSNLSCKELQEISKIIDELKEKANTKEEFINVLKRWQSKFPEAKYFCTGYAWKGAYESSSEFGAENYDRIHEYLLCRLYNDFDPDLNDDPKFMKQFKTPDDFTYACLNPYVMDNKSFLKEVNSSLHKPKWNSDDAQDLCEGESLYGFIDIKTGKTFYLSENAY